jgi:hypothetical protein
MTPALMAVAEAPSSDVRPLSRHDLSIALPSRPMDDGHPRHCHREARQMANHWLLKAAVRHAREDRVSDVRRFPRRSQKMRGVVGVDRSREEKNLIEQTCLAGPLVHGVMSTAIGPRAPLSLELKPWHLSLVWMSPEPVQLVARLPPAAVAD